MTLWLLLSLSALAADCNPAKALEDAEQLVLEARLDVARQTLAEIEESYSCGALTAPDDLARAWLIEGALETIAGNTSDAEDVFRAARYVAPAVWLPSLGEKLKILYDNVATESMGLGEIAVSGAPEGAFGAVDGQESSFPAAIQSGLHLVQVGRSAEEIMWSQIVYVPPAQQINLRIAPFGLQDPPLEAVAEPVTETNASVDIGPSEQAPRGWFAHLAVGTEGAFGEEISTTNTTGEILFEPASKWTVPFELGITNRFENGWFRAAIGGSPMLEGTLIFGTANGAIGWPAAVFGYGGFGASFDAIDLGVIGGISIPGRVNTRTVLSAPIGDAPLRAEFRAGLNFPSGRRTEPVVALLLQWEPSR